MAVQEAPVQEAPTEEFGEPWRDTAESAESGLELVLEGSTGQLSLKVGGKAPTSSKLTLTGGQIEVASGFTKGERIRLIVEADVQEVAFRDEKDAKTGQVVGCARKHKARIVRVDEAPEL